MTADLVAFLRERLDEDEQTAQHAFGAHNGGGPEWVEVSSGALSAGGELHGIGDAALTRHMARHDPARVLAEVAAKRRILAEHAVPHEAFAESVIPVNPDDRRCVGCGFGSDEEPMVEDIDDCPILQALALPYASHPDYRPEWAPSPTA